jgi:hypothetical protein
MDIQLGSFTIKPAEEAPTRLAMLLWGPPGCGKTTIAATAPGKKLWILFDDGGLASVQGLRACAPSNSALSSEILVLDLSHERNNLIDKFKRDDGLGLSKILEDESIGIETVVVDSVTRISQMALEHSVASGIHKGAVLERVSPGAYGGRNALLLRMFVDIMNVTGKYNKNVIFIAHEAAPSTNDDGAVLAITMSLGGQLPTLTTQKLGEVWFMQDTDKGRRVHIRPFRVYKPMKSRMFNLGEGKPGDFYWKYDIEKPDVNFEIATWYNKWRDGGGQKIDVPK